MSIMWRNQIFSSTIYDRTMVVLDRPNCVMISFYDHHYIYIPHIHRKLITQSACGEIQAIFLYSNKNEHKKLMMYKDGFNGVSQN